MAELLAARGVIVTAETIRRWSREFGQADAHTLRRRRARPGDNWPLDEVFMTINGATHSLWRAVDQDGHVRDLLVQRRRSKAAAKQCFRRLRTGLQYGPRVLSTDTRERRGGAAGGAAARGAPATQTTQQAGGARAPADQGAGAADAALQAPGAGAALPRRLWPARFPLPPTPPPPDRRNLSPGQNGTLRHLAGGHRHPGAGLTEGIRPPQHASKYAPAPRSDFN